MAIGDRHKQFTPRNFVGASMPRQGVGKTGKIFVAITPNHVY